MVFRIARPQTLPLSCSGASTPSPHARAHCGVGRMGASGYCCPCSESRAGIFYLSRGFWGLGCPHCRIWPLATAGFSDAHVLCFGSLWEVLSTVTGATWALHKVSRWYCSPRTHSLWVAMQLLGRVSETRLTADLTVTLSCWASLGYVTHAFGTRFPQGAP